MSGKTMAAPAVDQKQIGTGEFIWYMVSVFFYTNMTGMVGAVPQQLLSGCGADQSAPGGAV